MKVRISTRAEMEMDKASEYYFRQMGERGVIDLRSAVRLALNALLNYYSSEIKYELIRTRKVKPFPYMLHYRILNDEIIIESFTHERSIKKA